MFQLFLKAKHVVFFTPIITASLLFTFCLITLKKSCKPINYRLNSAGLVKSSLLGQFRIILNNLNQITMSNWKTLPVDVPTNGQTVWVRITYFYGAPFQAVYNSTNQTFTSVINSIVFPAYTIAR